MAGSPFLPSALAISFGGGSSLTALPLSQFTSPVRVQRIRSTLAQCLPLLDELKFPTTSGVEIDDALKVLQAEREAEAAEETRNGARSPATDQDTGMGDGKGQSPASPGEVDNALEILVRNATEEVGFAPRDVYNGVFNLPGAKQAHTATVEGLDYSEPKTIVREFVVSEKLDGFSHRIVTVYPQNLPDRIALDFDAWAIDFKSVRIAREVMESMRFTKLDQLWEAYDFFYKCLGSSGLAGWFFKKLIHRMLSSRWSDTHAAAHPHGLRQP